jgi:hypothetical protein
LPPVQQRPVRSAAARRRTSRRSLIISVLVVLVGGLLAFAGGQVLTRHTQVLAVAQDVPVGATIKDSFDRERHKDRTCRRFRLQRSQIGMVAQE